MDRNDNVNHKHKTILTLANRNITLNSLFHKTVTFALKKLVLNSGKHVLSPSPTRMHKGAAYACSHLLAKGGYFGA